jgi:hypothetical protein
MHTLRTKLSDDELTTAMVKLAQAVGPVLDNYRGAGIPAGRAPASDMDILIRSTAEAGLSRQAIHADMIACRRRRASAPKLFDATFTADEQLPRHFEALLSEKMLNGKPSVITMVAGVIFGDRLTDTIHFEPGSRYHDAFHLAHAAHLGWSPVLRHLLGRQRVSDPELCELEDSVRAQVIEEAIITYVFNYLRKNDFLRGAASVDTKLLDELAEIYRGYEVEQQPREQWEAAILAGARLFCTLRENKGGRVRVDMLAGSLRCMHSTG